MQFDLNKLKALILYTCAKCPPEKLGAVKLHKVLYFADMIHYAKVGSSITGATYKKRALGPTCDQLLTTLRDLNRAGALDIRDVDYFGFIKKEYVARLDPEIERLGKDARAIVDEIINFVCFNNSAQTISDFSHQRPWEMVEFGETIPYHSAFLLFPSEVSLEALEWADTEVARIDDRTQGPEQVVYKDIAVFRRRLREASGAHPPPV
jgi:hypothetical protein